MKVAELRKRINLYNKEELTDLVVELYKRIPKVIKEDYDIDNFIMNNDTKKKIIKEEKVIEFSELSNDIKYFLTCVDNDLYIIPNKVIPKKERSNWRFKVKKYYKELLNISFNSPNYDEANELLLELFKRLSLGCGVWKFSSENPFQAIGVNQYEYLNILSQRILSKYQSKDYLNKLISLINSYTTWDMTMEDLYWAIYSNINDLKVKQLFLDLIIKYVDDMNKLNIERQKKNSGYYYSSYTISEFIEIITNIYFDLNEVNEGIKYYQKNYIKTDREIKEYVLLSILEKYELYEEWINEYNTYKNKVNFRKEIQEKYLKIKESLK